MKSQLRNETSILNQNNQLDFLFVFALQLLLEHEYSKRISCKCIIEV